MREIEGRLPDVILACVGGGSNAAGIFCPFIDERSVRLIGVEAAGEGLDGTRHAATLAKGHPGVLHGMHTIVLQDDDGQTLPVHSVSAGLDYPGVGPEHAHWHETGRVEYTSATDTEALDAFELLSRLEGIIPALESAHAVAHAVKIAPKLPAEQRHRDQSQRTRRQGLRRGRADPRASTDVACGGRAVATLSHSLQTGKLPIPPRQNARTTHPCKLAACEAAVIWSHLGRPPPDP
jgi:hypothetical protein